MFFPSRKKIFILGGVLAIVFFQFVFMATEAKAGLFGIDTILNSAIASVILYFQGLVLGFVGTALAEIAKLFGLFLKAQGNYFKDITIVQTSWTVFRDFANMFFILILVIIAFATIFDIQKYNWKGLMAKFLVAALLINFSLVIGQFIINFSITLSNVMLNQFSDITGNLAGGFGLNTLISNANAARPTADAEKLVIGTIISFMGITIVTAIAMLSMLAAFIFSVVRIPILWALLIISPIAWISSILPNTRALHQWWWKTFLGWVFFMPLYLFTLMMGLVILTNRADLDAAANLSLGQTALSRAGNFFGFAAQDIFFYILTVIILVWGLGLAIKASFLGGTGVTQTFGAISGNLNNWAKRTSRLSALQTAGKEKITEVQEKGLPGKFGLLYGGKRAEDLRAAKMRERFGLKEDAYSRELLAQRRTDVDKAMKDYLDRNLSQAEIDGQLSTEKDQNKILALRKIRAENGWIPRGRTGMEEVQDTVRILGKNTKDTKDYINSLVKHRFKDMAGNALEMQAFVNDSNTSNELRKAALRVMADQGDLGELQNEGLFRLARALSAEDSKPEKDALDSALTKNFDRLDKSVVNDLIASGEMNDDQVLDLYERRVEKGWLSSGAAGKKEILDNIALFGGPNSQRGQKYINTLIKFDFMDQLGKQADQEDFIKDLSVPEIVRNAGVEVMAKNNNLISDELIKIGLDSLTGQVKEKRDRIYDNLKKNIKNLNKTKPAREAFLFDTSKSNDMRKLQAEGMLDDGELDTYKKYSTAEGLFGGENETLSRKALTKLAQENQIIHAETEWRKERASTTGNDRFVKDDGFFGSTADASLLRKSFVDRLQKMDPSKIAELNKDSWQKPEFEQALQKKITDLQTADSGDPALLPYRPPQTAIPPGGSDSSGRVYPTGRAAQPARGDPAYPAGRTERPGAGKRLKENIQRLIAGNNDKVTILNRITV